jgi:hypothetical protein
MNLKGYFKEDFRQLYPILLKLGLNKVPDKLLTKRATMNRQNQQQTERVETSSSSKSHAIDMEVGEREVKAQMIAVLKIETYQQRLYFQTLSLHIAP